MAKTNRPYRLGIDVGSNSLGCFVVWLNAAGDPEALGPGLVRIFPNGRDPRSTVGESNAVSRRVARGARRRRDRYLKRRALLMKLLIAHGLMPAGPWERKALESLDPYKLRAMAIRGALPAEQVGRSLFHLNQRRGFLSNRKSEKKDSESGAIKAAATRLQRLMDESGAQTLGEFMWRRHQARQTIRARNHGTGTKAEYDFYPTRAMLRDEFEKIWTEQAKHHECMTSDARDEIGHAIFDQRPLKEVSAGKCSLDPAKSSDDAEGFRCPWAHPLAQRFRIWQEVRNLAVVETGRQARKLGKSDGDKIALALFQNSKLSFDRIRGLLGLPPEARFNLESEKREKLLGDETAAKLSAKSLYGKSWRSFPLARQIEIVTALLQEPDEKALVEWLCEHTEASPEVAERAASAILPEGYCRLGLRAIRNIVRHMESGLDYTKAAAAAGYDHALLPTGEISSTGRLPYYGEWLHDDVVGTGDDRDSNEKRWGRFPNPTVHIGLGQLRRVVNALIREFDAPSEVVVEMTRDFKLSPAKLKELERKQTENQQKNAARAERIRGLGHAVNQRNLLKLRLWEEQNLYDPMDRRCPYSGDVIGIERLLSEETDIDHLIPFSASWDDSAANKIVCMRYANRAKGNHTPYDAFGRSPNIDGRRYSWDEITTRAALLPNNKRWRFAPDAMERFEQTGGFQARQLNETGWLARVAKQYLGAVTDPYKIHVLPGKLTAMIRAKWGLNDLLPDHNYSDAKNRLDHRHHAIDALVAALTDRKLLHRMASTYDEERQKIEVPVPWPAFRNDLDEALRSMTVSHKPDHGVQAQLHEATAYGTVRDPEKEGANLVYRKAFIELKDSEIERIRDRRLRDLVQAHIERQKREGIDLKSALMSFAARTDIPGHPGWRKQNVSDASSAAHTDTRGVIRHVRLMKVEKVEYLVPVPNTAPHKFYSAGENAYVEIYETEDGRWDGEAISVFRANQRCAAPKWPSEHPGAKLVMRVFKGDLIKLDVAGTQTVMVVHRLDARAGRCKLAAHNEAGKLDRRHEDPADPFRWLMASYNTLKRMDAERVRVDELGRLWRVRPNSAS